MPIWSRLWAARSMDGRERTQEALAVAAGIVLLEQAGCAVSDIYSDPFRFDMQGGFLCTAPGLKGAFRAVIPHL